MALTILHSNRYDWLLKELVQREQSALSLTRDPFENSTVWITSAADEWEIRRSIADSVGICANLIVEPLAKGLWRSSSELLGSIASQSPFYPQALQPLIFSAVEDKFEAQFETQMNSATDEWGWLPKEQSQRLLIAHHIAKIFSRYVTYRQDWLSAWQSNNEPPELACLAQSKWQGQLWRYLADRISLTQLAHPLSRLNQLSRGLGDGALRNSKSVPRFHVFNSIVLAPMYREALRELSRVFDVSVYFFNPSPNNWHDRSDDLPLLLASLGGQRRQAFKALNDWIESDGASEIAFYESGGTKSADHSEPEANTNALAAIQSSLNSLQLPSSIADKIPQSSIVIYSCDGVAQSLLSVRQSIEALLVSDPTIKISDCLVLLPRTREYQSSVQLLGWLWGGRLAYRLADIALPTPDALSGAWLELLALIDSDFEVDRVQNWLNLDVVKLRLGIGEEEHLLWRRWLSASGVKRGVLSADLSTDLGANQFSKGDDGHDWQSAVNWLLLRYAGYQTEQDPEELILAGLELASIGVLVHELEALSTLSRQIKNKRSWQQWREVLVAAFGQLIVFDSIDPMAEARVREQIRILGEAPTDNLMSQVRDVRLIDFNTIKVWFQTSELVADEVSRTPAQRSPVLTVATLGALRAQAFKAIFVLGLEALPAPIVNNHDDLMATVPRAGDASLRDADTGALLDAILAAQCHLEFFYVGVDASNRERLGDPLLVSMIEASVREQSLVVDRRISTALSIRYSSNPSQDALINQMIRRNALEIVDAQTLPIQGSEEFKQCLKFIENPLRTYLKKYIGVETFDDDERIEGELPFDLSALDLWQRRTDLLNKPSAALRRNFVQGNFGALEALPADNDIEQIRDIQAQRPEGIVISSVKSLRWELAISVLIDLAVSDSKSACLIAPDKSLLVDQIANKQVFINGLLDLRRQYFNAPFAFGKSTAWGYFKKIFGNATAPEKPVWDEDDAKNAQVILWSQQEMIEISDEFSNWLIAFGSLIDTSQTRCRIVETPRLFDISVASDETELESGAAAND